MSEKLPQAPQDEEVDLGQLFNAIGRLFEKLFAFIGKLFKSLFSIVIYALKPIVKNFKLIAIVLVVTGVVGFILDKSKKPVYKSEMLVKPYFGSKYELVKNVDHFNALIKANNLNELATVFEIDTSKAKNLLGFKMAVGPETGNDLFIEYNDYLKNVDSILVEEMSYQKYIANRDLLSSSIFAISANSHDNTIFKSLEKGFIKTFKNDYSEKVKEIRDKAVKIKTVNYRQELRRIDSIQKIYLQVIIDESKNPNANLSLTPLLPLSKEKQFTREYDLFRDEQRVRDSLIILEEQLVMENDYFDIVSGFEEVGTKDNNVLTKYFILFPLLAFSLIVLIFFLFKASKFIKEYE